MFTTLLESARKNYLKIFINILLFAEWSDLCCPCKRESPESHLQIILIRLTDTVQKFPPQKQQQQKNLRERKL